MSKKERKKIAEKVYLSAGIDRVYKVLVLPKTVGYNQDNNESALNHLAKLCLLESTVVITNLQSNTDPCGKRYFHLTNGAVLILMDLLLGPT